jgi:RIO-like serine/threonine protein kinase
MYTATLSDTDAKVIVKFTAHYNEAAHRLLAEVELAPKLHFCERVIGNLYMVVMDRVDGKSIWQLQKDKMPVPAIVFERVSDAVRLLHEKYIVFGDLRDPNILYDASEGRVVLVDSPKAAVL